MGGTTTRRTRRRGAALDDALLTAAWEELLEQGYDAFTMDAVADRADTSRTVLYRRWTDKDALILAALVHWREQNPITAPDTGSLRDDLVGYLVQKTTVLGHLATTVSRRLGELRGPSGEARERIIRSHVAALDGIWDRAVERGEVDAEVLTTRVRRLPGDLLRAELAETGGPVPRATIEEMVDTVVMPLVSKG